MLDNRRLDFGHLFGCRDRVDRSLYPTGRTAGTTTDTTLRCRTAVARTRTTANTTQGHQRTGKQIGNRRQHDNLLQKLRPLPRRARSRPDHQKKFGKCGPKRPCHRIGQRTLVGRIMRSWRDERRLAHKHIHGRSSSLSRGLCNRRADDDAKIGANEPERGTIGQRVPHGRD